MMDQDITPLVELARFYGISHNYLEVDPLDLGLDNESTERDCVALDCYSCEDPFSPIDFNEITREKLELDAPARALLFSTAALRDAPHLVQFDDRKKTLAKEAKVERPLLKFDDELTVTNALRRRETTVVSYKFPPWSIDEENDEGLTWPRSFGDLCAKYASECMSGKLVASRDAMTLLKTVMSPLRIEHAQADVIARDLAYTKSTSFQQLSPPLLPSTPRKHSPVTLSPILATNTLSDVTTSSSNELREVEDRLFSSPHVLPDQWRNRIETVRANSDDLDGLPLSMKTPGKITVFQSSPPRRKREDLKVEGPLTPACNVRSLRDLFIPDIIPDFSSMSELNSETHTKLEDDFRMLPNDLVAFAAEANKLIRNENLQAADTLNRVTIPTLPDYGKKAPWRSTVSRTQADELVCDFTLPVAKLGLHHWPGLAKMERKLPWTPFTVAFAKRAVDESIDYGDSSTLEFLPESIGTLIDQGKFTWKLDGLRILDDAENEEEVACAPQRASESKEDSLHRRECEENEENFRSLTSPILLNQAWNVPRLCSPTPVHTCSSQEAYLIKADRQSPVDTNIFSNKFSASQKLDLFMDLQFGRASKKPRLEEPATGLASGQNNPNKDSNNALISSCSDGPSSFSDEGARKRQLNEEPVSFPLPSPLPRRSLIISSHLSIHHRSFIGALAILYPVLEIIERDSSPCQSYQAGSGATILGTGDADITVNPGTGILLTTLQKIKQRPLPGLSAATHNGETKLPSMNIRERISRVAPRYERLFVLVSAGGFVTSASSSSINGLEESDTSALLSLTIFATSIGAGIAVDFIPQGENALARWVAGLIANTSVPKLVDRLELLHEETLWEVFLRRAGMNAVAAQCVLEELKPRDQIAGESVEASFEGREELRAEKGSMRAFGLPAFAMMSAEERMKRFETLFQGSEVLNRASKLLDAKWL